ncbi:hypothetical protein SYNPS1DRAFT_26266 [Syncephalis pseudoplumigaleata]|uniref:Uncharacterized protein n=1 Tax=Syncephalis pseudoplumigaleata TaxID=1712513 RepID=A0A4P9Z7H0_9FUNG|nr:hypothetical protein SYNPS1DRAFT_26266 [Syncephalis pseudoplumigaleata]|eukprot:RKP28152.1 hypothetical protein SYNPS1DRAFT_26266 [Syncephalis pseudoplumigaleata]
MQPRIRLDMVVVAAAALALALITPAEAIVNFRKNQQQAGLTLEYADEKANGVQVGGGKYQTPKGVQLEDVTVLCGSPVALDKTVAAHMSVESIIRISRNVAFKGNFPLTLARRKFGDDVCYVKLNKCEVGPLFAAVSSLEPKQAESILLQIVKVSKFMQKRGWYIHKLVNSVCINGGKVVFPAARGIYSTALTELDGLTDHQKEVAIAMINRNLFDNLASLYQRAYGEKNMQHARNVVKMQYRHLMVTATHPPPEFPPYIDDVFDDVVLEDNETAPPYSRHPLPASAPVQLQPSRSSPLLKQ